MAAWPAQAQSPRIWRVGVLYVGPGSPGSNVASLKQACRELGLIEGRNVAFAVRSADGKLGRLRELADELAQLGVDVIVTGGSEATRAAKHATASVPIVFQGPSYPVEEGLVASFAHPGGNITGISIAMSDTVSKHLQLIKDIVPTAAMVGVVWSPSNPGHTFGFRDTERLAALLGMRTLSVPFTDAADLHAAVSTLISARPDALIVQPAGFIIQHIETISSVALKLRIPAISIQKEYAERGLLLSYGANFRDAPKRVAAFVDRILKGAKPADLPVERPSKFELVINQKTATAIGIAIPQALLLRADEVIQ